MINGHNYQTLRDTRIVASWEAEIREAIPGISDSSCGALARYLALGLPPGGFMTAMLSCNIREAMAKADAGNLNMIPDYVAFFMSLPPSCWGSPEAVAAWKGGIVLESL